MNMLSEALYIMDRNMERLMVEEMKEEVANAKAEYRVAVERAQAKAKAEIKAAKEEAKIFSLYISGKTSEEIADTLNTTLDGVNEVLISANITIQ